MQRQQPRSSLPAVTLADLKVTAALSNARQTQTSAVLSSTATHHEIPGNLLISQLSCFLEMLVQLRSKETGCRRIIPLSMSGVMEVQRFRSIFVHSLLSQHLVRGKDVRDSLCQSRELNKHHILINNSSDVCRAQICKQVISHCTLCTYHLFHVLQTLMQTHSSGWGR